MNDKLIILMAVLIVVAGVGGYFVGLYQGAGTLSLNLSNNSTGNVSNSSTTHKTTTVTPVKNKTIVTNNTQKNTTNSSQ
jgi:flagellar basal body-associated protein FliL